VTVRLRPLTYDDVETIAADEADAERIRRRLERNPTLEDGGFWSVGIEADGRLVGEIQARAPQHCFLPGVCEIGITLLPEARGRGVGREAVVLFTEQLFEQGLARVQASTAVSNTAMRRVLERLGWELEGVLRAYGPTEDGGREDYAMYAVTRDGPSGTSGSERASR
jgi:RimJ/RimL family protein N-acetyltransferase